MNAFFADYIDLTVLLTCVGFTGVNTVRMVRRATVKLRPIPAYFVVFGATANAAFMGVGHLFEISYHAIDRARTGAFVYDFRFYSLILMGMVLLLLSLQMLQHIQQLFRGNDGSQWALIRTMLLIVAVSAPTVVFSPVGYAPIVACCMTALALPFVKKPTEIIPTVGVPELVLAAIMNDQANRNGEPDDRLTQQYADSVSETGS